VGKQVKQCREAAKEHQHAHMAELAMAVDLPAPTASPPASPPAPTPLPVITTINGNGRIILAPPLFQKHYRPLSQPSLYLVGTPAQWKQGPVSGLMPKKHTI